MKTLSSLNRLGATCLGSLLLCFPAARAQTGATGSTGQPLSETQGATATPTVGSINEPPKPTPQPETLPREGSTGQKPEKQDPNARKKSNPQAATPVLVPPGDQQQKTDGSGHADSGTRLKTKSIPVTPTDKPSFKVSENDSPRPGDRRPSDSTPPAPDPVRILRIKNVRANAVAVSTEPKLEIKPGELNTSAPLAPTPDKAAEEVKPIIKVEGTVRE